MTEAAGGDGISGRIPALNEAAYLGRLIDGLLAMDFAEIIVADGGSRDGTQAIAASYSSVKLIVSGSGRGTAIYEGQSPYAASPSPEG